MAKRTSNNFKDHDLKRSVTAAQKAGEPAKFADGGGLYLIVTAAGRARFIHYFRFAGKDRERWFDGEYPDQLKLADARALRDADRALIRSGIDPIKAARADAVVSKGIPTFAEYAKAHADFLAPGREDCRVQWLRQMTGLPATGEDVGALAAMPIDSIKRDHVKEIIAPLWLTKPNTAATILGRISRVLDHRYVNTDQDERVNPADFKNMQRAIGRKYEDHRKNHPSLDYQQVPDFLARLALRSQMSARVLEMVIATGCRVGEITGARWNEIEWRPVLSPGHKGALPTRRFHPVLVIPAERMKTEHDTKGEPHVIPLSLAMFRTLRRAMPPHGFKPTDLIFPNGRGNEYPSKDVARHVHQLAGKGAATTHGFRSSLVNWGTAIEHRARPEFARDLMDACLAHKLGNEVSQAYLRDRWLERRRIVMREWSRYCAPPTAVVIPFRKAA